jgi:hypothetical protein
MSRHLSLAGILLLAVPAAAWADGVVQVDVQALLESRSVTTLEDRRLVTWTRGVDGGGRADGFLTREAAASVGDRGVPALPGNGLFPATRDHPKVQLHFSNQGGSAGQTHCVEGGGTFEFAVPRARFEQIQLFLTSAEGPSHLRVLLGYADGSVDLRLKELPDYYQAPLSNDPDFFVLAGDLGKWDRANRIKERAHHFIYGMNIQPCKNKVLTFVRITKGMEGYLVFWGATGVKAKGN